MKTTIPLFAAIFLATGCPQKFDAATAAWKIVKNEDTFTNTKSCSIQADGPVVTSFNLNAEGTAADALFFDLAKPVRLRIDRQPTVSGFPPFKNAEATALFAQIRQGGKSIQIAYYHPDSPAERTVELNLIGVAEKIQQCEDWQRTTKAGVSQP
jgi:hypothetical protein